MVHKLSMDYNVEGRIERVPLGIISYILNIIGIIGNGVVIHIFRRRTAPSSNYRIFVLYLSVVDLFICVSHISKELNRMIAVYDQVSTEDGVVCKISNYVGNSVGYASLSIVLFIGFERYRKICKPFKTQFTIKHSKIICMGCILLGFVIKFPVCLIYGKRYVKVESINASRCDIENKYDGNSLLFLFYTFRFVITVTFIILIAVFQVNIRNSLVKKSKIKRQMKNKVVSERAQSECSTSTLNVSSIQKEKGNQLHSKESIEDIEADKNRRIAITFAFVTVFLVASFVTITLFQSIQAIKRFFFPRAKISKMEDIIQEYLPDVVIISGILNPFVYFFTDVQFKRQVMKLCGSRT